MSIDDDPAQFRRPLGRDFKGVRVAWWRGLGGIPFEPEIRRVVDGTRKVFEELGCVVEDAEPDFTGLDQAFPVLRYVVEPRAVLGARQGAARVGQGHDQVRGGPGRAADRRRRQPGPGRGRRGCSTESRQFFESYEYFILPVTQVEPFDVTTPYPTEIAGTKMASYIDWMRSCWYVTMMTNPAISVPAGFSSAGLPVGLQIVGRHRDEWSVLQLAHAFEQATRHGEKTPAVPAKAVCDSV